MEACTILPRLGRVCADVQVTLTNIEIAGRPGAGSDNAELAGRLAGRRRHVRLEFVRSLLAVRG